VSRRASQIMNTSRPSSRLPALVSLGLVVLAAGCASESAAHHQRRAEEHVYIGPRRSFLDRAARLLVERGQSPQLLAPDTLQTRWILVSGATSDPRHGAEPLVFQSWRVTLSSIDDLHHHIRFERGTVTTFQTPTRSELEALATVPTDSRLQGAEDSFPSLAPPGATGAPVYASDGELEWEFLRRTDPDAAAIIEQEKAR